HGRVIDGSLRQLGHILLDEDEPPERATHEVIQVASIAVIHGSTANTFTTTNVTSSTDFTSPRKAVRRSRTERAISSAERAALSRITWRSRSLPYCSPFASGISQTPSVPMNRICPGRNAGEIRSLYCVSSITPSGRSPSPTSVKLLATGSNTITGS